MRKVIGYTLGLYPKGQLHTPMPEGVFELTFQQQQLKELIEKLRLQKRETEKLLEQLAKELAAVQGSCEHPVFNDHDAWPFIERRCEICGQVIDTI